MSSHSRKSLVLNASEDVAVVEAAVAPSDAVIGTSFGLRLVGVSFVC